MENTNNIASLMNARGEELPESETPWQESMRLFKKDRLALMGAYVLGLLLITAFLGKALTEWVVVFDPEDQSITIKDKKELLKGMPNA